MTPIGSVTPKNITLAGRKNIRFIVGCSSENIEAFLDLFIISLLTKIHHANMLASPTIMAASARAYEWNI